MNVRQYQQSMIKIVRKQMKCFCLLLALFMFLAGQQKVYAAEDLTPNAASSILIEVNGGKVIYGKQEHERLYPASMTKMMGMLLIMEAINQGKLTWDTIVTVSDHAASMGGSQIYLKPLEQMRVDDLFKSVAIASANDAIVALGEKIASSEENFVQMMNDRAKKIGLSNTHFTNASGLHDPEHYSTAYDMAMIGRELVRVGGDALLKYTSTYDAYVREDTDNKFWLVNTNKLVRFYEGTDGLKTGFTQDSKYCITVTTKRGGLRLIAVVMKEPTSAIRNKEVTKLMDYGFGLYDTLPLYVKDQVIQQMQVENGKPKMVDVKIKDEIREIIQKGQGNSLAKSEVILSKTTAPLVSGEVVGKIKVQMVDGIVVESDLIVGEDVIPLTYFDVLKNTMNRFWF